ncbi:putative SANT/Myb domain, Homeobox-like domain superfamily protein [Plasmopara halstedii]
MAKLHQNTIESMWYSISFETIQGTKRQCSSCTRHMENECTKEQDCCLTDSSILFQSSICTTSLTTYTAQLTIYMMRTSMRSIERGLWSGEEHDRFLMGLKLYPHGPWRKIAGFVGTRSPRQVQTHAQKYYEKVGRRLRGLRKDRKKLVRPEHRLDEDMVQLCQLAKERVDPNGHVDPTLTRLLRAPLSSSTQVSNLGLLANSTDQYQKMCRKEMHHMTTFESSSPCSSATSNFNDSTTSMDLSDFDDSCLDFLMTVLSASTNRESIGMHI